MTTDSLNAYQHMTPEERERYDALVQRLDSMLVERKNKERRQQTQVIDFDDRRVSDRRK